MFLKENQMGEGLIVSSLAASVISKEIHGAAARFAFATGHELVKGVADFLPLTPSSMLPVPLACISLGRDSLP